MNVFPVFLCFFLLLFPVSAQQTGSGGVDEALSAKKEISEMGEALQARIASLDDETRALLNEYRGELQRFNDLDSYNKQLERMIASQNREKDRIEGNRKDLEDLKRDMLPLMLNMLETLEKLVSLDKPFLVEERGERLAALRETFDRADVGLPEKLRRLLEAYQVEADYGRTIEAYEEKLPLGGEDVTVELLRFGRVALYYRKLDNTECGMWNDATRKWITLPQSYIRNLERAIRVARRQAAPQVLTLPMPTPEESE